MTVFAIPVSRSRGRSWIGRSQGNAIILNHYTVSRKHPRLTVTDERILLEDAGAVPGGQPSSNGTVLLRQASEQRLETSAVEIQDGDEVRCGDVPVRVRITRSAGYVPDTRT